MEELTKTLVEHGGAAGFGALFLLKLGEMVWNYLKNREKLTDDTLTALKVALEENTAEMHVVQNEMCKLKLDLRRCFFVLKKVAGDNWPKLAEEMRNFSSDL